MNPGGSVKDRAGGAIVNAPANAASCAAAAQSSRAPPVTPASALRTCAMQAATAASSSCRTISRAEKYRLLEMLGAEVHQVPAVPYSNPNQYQKVAQRLAAALPDAIWSNQFDNTANRDAHFHTTGPEIWEQTRGGVDAFVAACGTGGTFAGVAQFLKSRRAGVRCVLADPPGSSLYLYVRTGTLQPTGTGSITEGIGIGRVTANLKDAPIDQAVHVEDAETVHFVYRLLIEEGLFLGSTSGINVAAAVRVAREMGPGHTIVTVLCDSGAKYQSRLFNRAWLEQKGLAAYAPALPQASLAVLRTALVA